MELLIGFLVGVGLLWAWLSGTAIGRVVACCVIVPILMFLFDDALGSVTGHAKNVPAALIYFLLIGIAAWLIAGIPTYCHRASAMTKRAIVDYPRRAPTVRTLPNGAQVSDIEWMR